MNWKNLDRKSRVLVLLIIPVCFLISVWSYEPAKEALMERFSFAEETSGYTDLNGNPITIYDLSPLDEEGTRRVEQEEPIKESDTWTICYYMIGSDLEDQAENNLSEITRLITEKAAAENKILAENKTMERLLQYADWLQEQGLDFPEYLYAPVHPLPSSEAVTKDVVVADMAGVATEDISEICQGLDSDKIHVVIQTGGATRWGNSRINPNKTQRFTVENGHLKELANMPLQDSCNPDTLADFLNYCEEQYPADHRMVVLWDHGSGAFGYGRDDIYQTSMSLKDIRKALESVCEPDPENPHYDLIGFDACLMASVENAHMLYGYGKYLVGCEQTEPGGGWSHDVYLQAMSEDPTMSPAAIGKTIADSFVDFYMDKNCGISNPPFYSITTSFSLMDLNAAEETYKAYCELNETLLKDAVADNHVLTKISSAAQNSTRLSGESYEIYNLIDLGNYMDALSVYYPKECGNVLQKLEEAVLYHRANGYLSDSTGMNIYMPVIINSTYGLDFFLTYLNEVSDDMATRALYYYKISGCLNDEYQDYAGSQGYGTAKTIETDALKKLADNEIVLKDKGFQISLNEEQKNNYQYAAIEVAAYDAKQGLLTAYGKNNGVTENNGVLSTDFDGTWICLDGCPLYTEVVSESDQAIVYRSPVKINDENYYLILSYDKEENKVFLTGASIYNADALADASAAHVIGKTTISLQEGDIIRPVYTIYDLNKNVESRQESEEKIVFSASSKAVMTSLPDGTYLNALVLTDIRGDEYYSAVVEQTIEHAKISKQQISDDFVGSTY